MKTWPIFPKSRKKVGLNDILVQQFKLKEDEKLKEISVIRTLRFLDSLAGAMVCKGANAEECVAVFFYTEVVRNCKKLRLNWAAAKEYFGIEKLTQLYMAAPSKKNEK